MCSYFLITLCFLDLLGNSATGIGERGDTCPVWFVFDDTVKQCLCHNVEEWVICNQFTQRVYLARGLCMTFDNDTEAFHVGKCPYTIFEEKHKLLQTNGYIELPKNASDLNEFMCGQWNREGYLCSRCKKGYGLAIPNVFMSCVQCRFNRGIGWIFYIVLQLSPVIILFTTLFVFRVSVAKPPLNAYVTFCHLSLAVLFVHSHRFLSPFVNNSPALIQAHYVSMVATGVWAMSFTGLIRGVGITDFCVDTNVNIQQAFILTQIKSLFPLVLIAFTYVCIQLHNRNFKLIVWLWKPFRKCFTHYTEVWHSKLSLVDVFSTYLLLSYSRYIIVLYFMYSFQHTYRAPGGWNGMTRLLYNPSVTYFHPSEHLPYALVLLFTLLTVAVPPILLLAFYQTKLLQRILSCVHLQGKLAIHIFVDLFQGSYRNGLDGGYDLRFTASFYIILRIAVLLTYGGCNNTSYTSCDTLLVFIWVFLLLLFFSLVRPYKHENMNILDSLLLASLAMINLLLCSISYNIENKAFNLLILVLVLIIITFPQVILFIYVVYKLCCCFSHCNVSNARTRGELVSTSSPAVIELSESLPDRFDHPYGYHEKDDF